MYVTKRSGFAMIMAIFIVVLISLGGVMLLSNSSMSSKTVGDKYLHAQAEMLALSATEFAVMRAQGFDTAAGKCLKQINITVQDSAGVAAYDVNISIKYSFKGAQPNSECSNAPINATLAQGTGNDTMMLIDTVVKTNTEANLSTEPIRVVKRSWQRL
jgi:hypothetical protein